MASTALMQVINDPLLYMALLTIKDKTGSLVPLVPNRAQRHFYANMTGRDIVLKARQMGFSTFIQGWMYYQVTTNIGRTAVTISHDRDSTERLRDKFKTFPNGLPDELKPIVGKDDKTTTRFTKLLSSSYIGTAGNRAFGRGDTAHHVHCSELAFWPAPRMTLTGLMQAIPSQHVMPSSSIMIESTANGNDNMFYKMCMDAYKGDGAFKLHFYPWWWDSSYSVPLNNIEHVRFDPSPEEKELMTCFSLTREQINWRRRKMDEMQSLADTQGADPHELFLQEYPEDVLTCFISSGRSRFDKKALRYRLENQCMMPIAEKRLDEQIWGGYEANNSPAWRIYKEPVAGRRYVMGADPSGGDGTDSSAGVVRDWENNEQVATLHGRFEPYYFARYVADMARLYNHAVLGVERNNHGHAVLGYLLHGTPDYGSYNNLYAEWPATGGMPKLGWHTNSATRPVMLADLATEYANPEVYTIRDAAIVDQALGFVVKRNNRAEGERHDDLIFADAIAGQMRQVPSGASIGYGKPDD